MNDLLKQKSTIISAIIVIVGVCFQIRGKMLSDSQMAALHHGLGALFELIGVLIPWFKSMHMSNAQQIQNNRTVLNRTSTAGDLPPVPGTQAISPMAAQSVNSAVPPLVADPVQPTPKP